MNWRPSAFNKDQVTLTLWDIVLLLVGQVLESSGCTVRLTLKRPR